MPADVRRLFGFAFSMAQVGDRRDAAKNYRSECQGVTKIKTRNVEGFEVHRVSGNVFADLGLADAERLKIKTGLVIEIK